MSHISGAIIFFGFVIVLISIIWLSSGNILFSRDYSIFAKFPEVTGLREQSPVFLRGYRIGVTKDVTFQKDGIVIRLNINKSYSIPKGSKFAVSTVNLIGEKAIAITPMDTIGDFIRPGDTVSGENKDIMIALQGLLAGFRKNIEDGDIAHRISRLGESIDLMQSILTKLDVKVDQLDVAELNKQLGRIGDAGRQVQEFFKTSQPDLQELTKEGRDALVKIEMTCDQVSNLARSVQSVSDKINHGEGSASEFINNPEYIANLNAAVMELRKLLEDIKANPHRYVKLSVF